MKKYRVEITVGKRKHLLTAGPTSRNAYHVAMLYSRLAAYEYYRHLSDPDHVGKFETKPHVKVREATLN